MYFRFFANFSKTLNFLRNRNIIFEESSLKAFLRPSFRVFVFSNLSSNSRYFESGTLEEWNDFHECMVEAGSLGSFKSS